MEDPIAPLEKLACDHIISRTNLGTKGETCSFVIVDRFSGMIGISPSKSKDSDSVEVALRKFCGRSKAGIVSVSSDRAHEIIAAVERLGFTTEPSEPRQSLHNPYAESMIRTVKGITSSVLLQSGLGHQFWPLAHRYVEWMYPITKDSPIDPEITCYEAHHGYAYEGLKIPFGSLVFIKTLDPPPFAPKGEGALFLGGELIAGQKFKGLYHVMPLSSFKDETFRERVVRTIGLPPGPFQFPAKVEGRDSLKINVEPGYLGEISDDDRVEDDEGLDHDIQGFLDEMGESSKGGGESSGPASARAGLKPKPGGRNRKITKLRVASYGPTKGCEACKQGSDNHSKECRARFNELLDRAEPVKTPKTPVGGAPQTPAVDHEPMVDEGYEPSIFGDDMDESKEDVIGLISISKGSLVSQQAQYLERGKDVAASILLEAVENGDDEMIMSRRLEEVSGGVNPTQKPKVNPRKEWFVEFCCSSTSSCCKVCQQLEIPYLGLSWFIN